MAVDRKGDYVGNHGGAYTDENGMSRQFTYIDHDRKLPSRTRMGRESDEAKEKKAKELEEIRESLKKMNDDRISSILALPPYDMSIGEEDVVKKIIYTNFIIRDKVPTWDEVLVREACSIDRELCQRLFRETWRNTVREEHFFVDMSTEDILAGKWKELT